MNADRPIATLSEHDLPKRARNALLRSGIATLQDAAEWSDRDLLSLPNIGAGLCGVVAGVNRTIAAADRRAL